MGSVTQFSCVYIVVPSSYSTTHYLSHFLLILLTSASSQVIQTVFISFHIHTYMCMHMNTYM